MNIQNNIKVLDEDIRKLSNEKINNSIAQTLNVYYGAKIALESILKENNKSVLAYNETLDEGQKITSINNNVEYLSSANEFFQNHTEHNLKKLCLEIQELCVSIYATLRSEEEKNIFINAIKSIKMVH